MEVVSSYAIKETSSPPLSHDRVNKSPLIIEIVDRIKI